MITYTDVQGQGRFVSNNELAFYTTKNGDWVVEDIHGNVYKNFSQERRDKMCEKRKQDAIKNNQTTYCIDNDDHRYDWVCKGKRFKDFDTGDIYIIRQIKFKYYYIRISDGMVVRETDYQKTLDERKRKNGIKDYSFEGINISEFNEKQKTIEDKNDLYLDYKYKTNDDLFN